MKIISYLKQPFPMSENKWKTIISISLFVTFFIVLFQPFGIKPEPESPMSLPIIAGYGLATFIVLVIDLIIIERVFSEFFNKKKWLLWKEFLWLSIVIFTIGIANILYSLLFISQLELSIENILKFQLFTFAIAIFPILVLVITKQQYLFNKYSKIAKELNVNHKKENINNSSPNNHQITFYSYNMKKSIEFNSDDFYFIESRGNYLHLCLIVNNKLEYLVFRNTLKKSIKFFEDCPEIIQCHRAYIVNTRKILHAKGNSQGLKLKFYDCKIEISVSKNYVSSVKNIL